MFIIATHMTNELFKSKAAVNESGIKSKKKKNYQSTGTEGWEGVDSFIIAYWRQVTTRSLTIDCLRQTFTLITAPL